MDEYQKFIAQKRSGPVDRGIDVPADDLAPHLFKYQRHVVAFCLRAGVAGVFLDTGLGKTEVQLEWCQQILNAVGGRVLILTPLAVAGQTLRRAGRWGYGARIVRENTDCGPGINICNYDRVHKLDVSQFTAVSLDEASILKSFTGKTTRALIEMFAATRFKLVATATPAPNDHMELGQYAEFLGIMPSNEMLMRWFITDQTQMGRYRLKGHAVHSFWDWMASWSRMAQRPSDLGDCDDGFVLPPFQVVRHRAADSKVTNDLGDMFGVAMSATGLHDVKRQTSAARAAVAASVVNAERDRPWVIWVDTDYEADAVRAVIPDVVEVRGSMTADEKERRLAGFSEGNISDLLSKPSLAGFGMDWSHCDRCIYVGRSYSYETWYQSFRRFWRFGQKNTVVCHIVVAEGEDEIGQVIDRKAKSHSDMQAAMREAMRRATTPRSATTASYNPTHRMRIAPWLQNSDA